MKLVNSVLMSNNEFGVSRFKYSLSFMIYIFNLNIKKKNVEM